MKKFRFFFFLSVVIYVRASEAIRILAVLCVSLFLCVFERVSLAVLGYVGEDLRVWVNFELLTWWMRPFWFFSFSFLVCWSLHQMIMLGLEILEWANWIYLVRELLRKACLGWCLFYNLDEPHSFTSLRFCESY